MFRQFDSVTVALTGQLFFVLVVSTVLALIASYLLLRLYRRAVIKSMRRVGGGEIPPEPEHKPRDAPLNFNFLARRALKANFEAISPGARLTCASTNRIFNLTGTANLA